VKASKFKAVILTNQRLERKPNQPKHDTYAGMRENKCNRDESKTLVKTNREQKKAQFLRFPKHQNNDALSSTNTPHLFVIGHFIWLKETWLEKPEAAGPALLPRVSMKRT
jgi:hypothetical protein